jgi:hypothetical protein
MGISQPLLVSFDRRLIAHDAPGEKRGLDSMAVWPQAWHVYCLPNTAGGSCDHGHHGTDQNNLEIGFFFCEMKIFLSGEGG